MREKEKDTDKRLSCLRALQDQGDPKLFAEMCDVLVSTLVVVARGRSSGGSNNYGFYPFGRRSTKISAFKQIPSTYFDLVLGAMYPFVHKPEAKWEELLQKNSHPMTQLWSWPTLSLHLNFIVNFRANRKTLFAQYEKNGGKYEGLQQVNIPAAASEGNAAKRSLNLDDLSESDEDSVDNLFS